MTPDPAGGREKVSSGAVVLVCSGYAISRGDRISLVVTWFDAVETMSLRTRIRGYTAWVNFRLLPYNQLLNNVLMDLMSGTHIKYLIESLTGKELSKLSDMDGLSSEQIKTRVDWMMEELKTCNVLPQDLTIDANLFARRSSDQVFDLLWRLICNDIWFVWERLEYLQHEDEDVITEVPFKWTPDPPPMKKKLKKVPKKSLLSGFGQTPRKEDIKEEDEVDENWVKFPNTEYVKNFKKRKREFEDYPQPEECILEMVNGQLKKTKEGRNLHCYSIDDFVDSRVLCALVNSFIPGTFTLELLLNDRWSINLVLKTAERMFYAQTPMDSEDLVEADPMAVCSYFCFFFMMAFKYRQCKAVVKTTEHLEMQIRECNFGLDKIPHIISSLQELQKKKHLRRELGIYTDELDGMSEKFDLKLCKEWVKHVEHMKMEVNREIQAKMRVRFDAVKVPRNITINDLCLSLVINLTLSNGSGFYYSNCKETLTEGRKLILQNVKSGEFIDDFTKKSPVSVRELLQLPLSSVVEVNPEDYPQYEFYFESTSRNKHLKAGSTFIYQVFPGTTAAFQKLFIKMARENELESVEKMLLFFKSHPTFPNSKEPKTRNTALHCCSRNGHYEVVKLLLNKGADIDVRNNLQCTPLHSAVEGLQRQVCHLLIEWGAGIHIKNSKGKTPLESAKNDDFRRFLIDIYQHYSLVVPKIMAGDMDLLDSVLHDHTMGVREMASLDSRCINGSTLLHTAAYYGNVKGVKELLICRLDINLRDYKLATPLHRAKTREIMEVLIKAGADIDAEDCEKNTPLHIKCYGETNKSSELDCIEFLLTRGASLIKRNIRGLMPIHCCAMQGRVDVMRLMIRYDQDGAISELLNAEEESKPPSLLHLALANSFMDCSNWLLANGFRFKTGEQDLIMKRLLTEQIKVSKVKDVVALLLENGANVNKRYEGGNTALHLAASLDGNSEVLDDLLAHGADVDSVNVDGSTPLFIATQSNNQFTACQLLEHGANVRHKNSLGCTPFDHIMDYEEWIDCGFFTEEVKARLKAYNLKHARDLVRAISDRVKPSNPFSNLHHDMKSTALFLQSNKFKSGPTSLHPRMTISYVEPPSVRFLPPIKSASVNGQIQY
ncbi:hypothetical protein ScPMuIL_015547 [Solemya velum]